MVDVEGLSFNENTFQSLILCIGCRASWYRLICRFTLIFITNSFRSFCDVKIDKRTEIGNKEYRKFDACGTSNTTNNVINGVSTYILFHFDSNHGSVQTIELGTSWKWVSVVLRKSFLPQLKSCGCCLYPGVSILAFVSQSIRDPFQSILFVSIHVAPLLSIWPPLHLHHEQES